MQQQKDTHYRAIYKKMIRLSLLPSLRKTMGNNNAYTCVTGSIYSDSY